MAQISFLHLISQTYFIFHQVETKQVETMRVFENVILICEVFTFYFSFVSFGLVPMEWEFGTNTLLVHVSKHLEVRQKYSGPCRIFESSRDVFRSGVKYDLKRFIHVYFAVECSDT